MLGLFEDEREERNVEKNAVAFRMVSQIPTLEEDAPKHSFKETNQHLKDIMYVTTRLVILYTTTAGISMGSESFVHSSIAAACNDSSFSGYVQTGFVLFFGANSLLIGIGSMLVLIYACCHFAKSLRRAYHLYMWNWKHQQGGENPTDDEIKERHMNFFKHVTKEIVSISAATGIVAFVGHDTEKHRTVLEGCGGSIYLFISNWIYWLNDIYKHIAAFVCFVSLYIGFATCAIWWYRSHRAVKWLWGHKHGCYHIAQEDEGNVELKQVIITRV